MIPVSLKIKFRFLTLAYKAQCDLSSSISFLISLSLVYSIPPTLASSLFLKHSRHACISQPLHKLPSRSRHVISLVCTLTLFRTVQVKEAGTGNPQ